MADWTLILQARDRQEAEMVRGRLEANDIPAVVMDQRSSVYPMMGNIEVLVERDHVMRALRVLRTEMDQEA
jgi:hypothetical protein